MKVHAPQKLSLETKSPGEITPEKNYGIERQNSVLITEGGIKR